MQAFTLIAYVFYSIDSKNIFPHVGDLTALSMDSVMDIHEGLAEWCNYMFCYKQIRVLIKMFAHL